MSTLSDRRNATIGEVIRKMTPAMRRAVLAAAPTATPGDYTVSEHCPGHSGTHGVTYCDHDQPCAEALASYRAAHEPDPDVLHIASGSHAGVGTVVALISRGILTAPRLQSSHEHGLTELGYGVHAALKAQAALGIEPKRPYAERERERAYAAANAARRAARQADAGGLVLDSYAHGLAACVDWLADSGDTSPASLHAIARAMRGN